MDYISNVAVDELDRMLFLGVIHILIFKSYINRLDILKSGLRGQ